MKEIAVYFDVVEAQQAKSLLDGEGIDSFLKDEHSVQVTPYLAPAIGGIKLMVYPEDSERAIAALQSGNLLPEQDQGHTFIYTLVSTLTNVPFLKHYSFEVRGIFLLACFSVLFTIVLLLLSVVVSG